MAGVEPALLSELDFESSASTNSTTPAQACRGGPSAGAPPFQRGSTRCPVAMCAFRRCVLDRDECGSDYATRLDDFAVATQDVRERRIGRPDGYELVFVDLTSKTFQQFAAVPFGQKRDAFALQ